MVLQACGPEKKEIQPESEPTLFANRPPGFQGTPKWETLGLDSVRDLRQLPGFVLPKALGFEDKVNFLLMRHAQKDQGEVMY